ncbi:hypothetical protein RMN57_09005 [Kitasatospora sp. CM 4170]|uniref:Secreted protein n=1 Tax=Kitasatospora aburaviensis TaxID=67265 RepID=A0ABW1EVC8_9ACTN|nr:hypothetical protein [Kitasatospora sp. CM 4170]WNM44847.1 hypothetical protein RMN57_09005 [Kitasatospora sp. CM 4170]
MRKSISARFGALAVAAMATATLVATATPASAGTNGQQIKWHNNSNIAQSYKISGYNNDNEWNEGCFRLYYFNEYSTAAAGWWWKYNVNVQSYSSTDCSSNTRLWYDTVNVPKSQSGDWVTIQGY